MGGEIDDIVRRNTSSDSLSLLSIILFIVYYVQLRLFVKAPGQIFDDYKVAWRGQLHAVARSSQTGCKRCPWRVYSDVKLVD